MKCEDWDPKELHASVQGNILQWQYLDNDIPFASGRKLIINIPINPKGYADVYINDTMGLTIDLPGTMNANRLKAVIALAIEVAAQPLNLNEPIPQELMVALEKLIAEGGLTETKMMMAWLFNFRTLTVTLLEHKYIGWSQEIKQMIEKRGQQKSSYYESDNN